MKSSSMKAASAYGPPVKEWPEDPRFRTYTPEEDEVYRELAKRLTDVMKFPESKWLPRVYKMIATPDQARVLLELPADVEETAKKLGLSKQFVEDAIQDQFEKGTIIYTRGGKWFLPRVMYQFHNATLPTRKYEDEDWWKDYEDTWGALYGTEMDDLNAVRMKAQTAATVRILCDHRVLDTLPPEDVTPYDHLKDILAALPPIAYEPCSCKRKERTRQCRSPENTCIINARTAEYNLKRNLAWEISVEEGMEIQDKGTDWGLVGTAINTKQVTGVICICHPDICCDYFRPAIKRDFNIQRFVTPSRYLPEVDPAKCQSCQTCLEECPFGAIKMKPYPGEKHPKHPLGSLRWKSWSDPELCMGCGHCVLACPHGARTMKLVHPLDWIPDVLPVQEVA